MRDTLTAHLATLATYVAHHADPMGPVITRQNLRDRRWVRAVLSGLKDEGFSFRFFTPREEQGNPLGGCSWFKQDLLTGEITEDKELKLSAKLNSLDALKIASHELAHAFTLDPEDIKGLFQYGPQEYRNADLYQWGEVVAEASAALVCMVVEPSHAARLVQTSGNYIQPWRNSAATLEEEAETIINTAGMILTVGATALQRM